MKNENQNKIKVIKNKDENLVVNWDVVKKEGERKEGRK